MGKETGTFYVFITCARPTRGVLDRALREYRKIIRLHPLLCSASKKGTWPLLSHPLPHILAAVDATIFYESV